MARRRPQPDADWEDEEPLPSSGGLGSMLRGSVNSMVGAAGLNLPLRAIEQLTRAVEHASSLLERMERASRRIDRVDPHLPDRVMETLDVIAALGEDSRAIRERLEVIEQELRAQRGGATSAPSAAARRSPGARSASARKANRSAAARSPKRGRPAGAPRAATPSRGRKKANGDSLN